MVNLLLKFGSSGFAKLKNIFCNRQTKASVHKTPSASSKHEDFKVRSSNQMNFH